VRRLSAHFPLAEKQKQLTQYQQWHIIAQPSPPTPTYTATTLLLGVISPHSPLMHLLLTVEGVE
jgi:hypothetical protein